MNIKEVQTDLELISVDFDEILKSKEFIFELGKFCEFVDLINNAPETKGKVNSSQHHKQDFGFKLDIN